MILDFLVGLVIGIAAITFLGANRDKMWSYIVILIWFALIAVVTFSSGVWWHWLVFAVWVFVVYDWRRPMRRQKQEMSNLKMLVILSNLYAETALATLVLAAKVEHDEAAQELEMLAELLTELGDDVTRMHQRLTEAIKQVATTESQNPQGGER